MKRIILVLVTSLFVANAMGQAITFQVPDFFKMRIKSIDEFRERFNREKLPPFLDSTDADLAYKQVVACFYRDSVIDRANEVVEFAYKMVDNNVLLSYGDSDYYCELYCNAHYKGKKTPIIIRMSVEQDNRGYFYWVISEAEGEILRLIPEKTSPYMRLSPIDNLQDFSELQEVLHSTPADISNYVRRSFSVDQTSVFLSMVNSRLLKYDEIKDMIYVFHKGGYEFKVKFFNKETNNNGWLIYDFSKNE